MHIICERESKTRAGWRRWLLWMGAAAACTGSHAALAQYIQTNLVSDQPGAAAHTDANLINPWGIAFNPTGFSWVANAATGTSTLYDGNGVANSLIVTVPPAAGGTVGAPTGIVYNGSSNFSVGGGTPAPARFLFAGEDGTISGWNPGVPPPPPSTHAIRMVDNSAVGSIYKGLAIDSISTGSRIYASDFHNGRVDVFGSDFSPINTPGAFTDPNLPAGYAPFGMQELGGSIYVSYALQDNEGEDDVPGDGHGFVDQFDTNGALVRRLISGGALNSPWAMTIAPANFGPFSNALLVGNFGNGRINAFDPGTGTLLGPLLDASNNPIVIDGLWGLAFGNGVQNQPTNTLFFSAGPDAESHGLYGRLDVPEPAMLGVLAVGALLLARRR